MPLWPYQDKTQPSQPQHSLANSFFHPCVSVEESLNVWAPNPSVRTHVGQVVYDCELQGSNARNCFGGHGSGSGCGLLCCCSSSLFLSSCLINNCSVS